MVAGVYTVVLREMHGQISSHFSTRTKRIKPYLRSMRSMYQTRPSVRLPSEARGTETCEETPRAASGTA